jgi:predicted N-formylglutamate amidohydrolase
VSDPFAAPAHACLPTDAVTRVDPARRDAPFVLSCEHASERLPTPWLWPAVDGHLLGTHWAYDLGAAELTRELGAATGAAAVLCDFTRLLVDPNRALDSPSLVVAEVDGVPVALNQGLDRGALGGRIGYWHAYHRALDAAVAASRAPLLLAIHSFTPVWQGKRRELEIGVLFDREQALAERLAARLGAVGFAVRLNEPYSGREGMIYAARRHAQSHGRRALELELRQDLAADRAARRELVAALAGAERALWEQG